MMTRLDRYVGRYYLSSWVVSVVFFMGLLLVYQVFGTIDELLEEMGKRDVPGGAVVRLYLYQMPDVLLKVAPFIMVMAALVALMRLQRHREYLAMVMTGRSPRRILQPVMALTFVFVIGLVVVQEVVAPRVALDRDRLEAELFEKGDDWIIENVSIKDASDQLFVAQDFNVSTGVVARVNVSYEDEQGRNVHIQGVNATWDKSGGWRLVEGTSTVRRTDTADEAFEADAAFVRTDIRPEDLIIDSRQPFDLSYGDVLDLSRRYPNSRKYRLLRHYHVTYPLSILLIVYLALPFVLRHDPRQRLNGLAISIGLCMALKIVDAAAWDLGSRGFLQPVLAAWLPVIVAGSLATVLFDSMEK